VGCLIRLMLSDDSSIKSQSLPCVVEVTCNKAKCGKYVVYLYGDCERYHTKSLTPCGWGTVLSIVSCTC